jgi:hypothetical protein
VLRTSVRDDSLNSDQGIRRAQPIQIPSNSNKIARKTKERSMAPLRCIANDECCREDYSVYGFQFPSAISIRTMVDFVGPAP